MPNECSICLSKMFFNRKKLICGHVFHKKCIKQHLMKKNTCPICSREIWINQEELNKRSLVIAIENSDENAINRLEKQVDPTATLLDFIKSGQLENVKRIIDSKFINWHKTIDGKSIFEIARDCKNERVFALVAQKFPYEQTQPHQNVVYPDLDQFYH